jgi:hypothetical protein
MWSWALVAVPAALCGVIVLLALVAWLETRILHPTAVIRWAVRVRNDPDHAEQVVAAEAARLLGQTR